jgi:hypothetical protein
MAVGRQKKDQTERRRRRALDTTCRTKRKNATHNIITLAELHDVPFEPDVDDVPTNTEPNAIAPNATCEPCIPVSMYIVI